MFAQIDAYVARCNYLSQAELDYFHSCLKPHRISKKEFLLREGEICKYEAYVVKGCLRKYCTDEAGDEVNLQFAVEDWWISDLLSFTEERPSLLNIQALEESELLLISHTDKEELFRRVPAMERMFRLMVQRSLNSLQERFICILSKSARQRYLDFVAQYHDLLTRIPQHHIASYLGVTPEFLSKVRKRLATDSEG
jgi:CRP-like cAMP-binding protein